MDKRRRGSFLLLALALAVLPAAAPQAPAPVAVFETVKGVFEIQFFPGDAPKSVAHLLGLLEKRFYRGQRIHWVQPGVVQFGDPQSRDMTKQEAWGRGGTGKPIGVAEPSKGPFVRGSVAMAYRSNLAPATADSQIAILTGPNPALNGKYAMLGRVTDLRAQHEPAVQPGGDRRRRAGQAHGAPSGLREWRAASTWPSVGIIPALIQSRPFSILCG